MGTDRQERAAQRLHPWWGPVGCSAAAVAAVAALFTPLPASAAPAVPAAPPAVPDAGSRPTAPGGVITLPGARAGTASATTLPVVTPGLTTSPLVRRIERERAAIAAQGDELIKLGEERDLARAQLVTADQRAAETRAAFHQAQAEAAAAAAAALRDAAAMPPGAVGSGLADLDALSRLQRGESASEEAASRQLSLAQAAQQAALAEQRSTSVRAADLSARYDTLNAQIVTKQAALQKLEQQNQRELTAAEAAASAVDRRLGEDYLGGSTQGRGADPRALAALTYALAQRGDPYEWSEEGPDTFDCSGLMFAAYRGSAAGNFPLTRVSRDQYRQTSTNAVDRYSLVPGDLLFFSSSPSWQGIHHVAMYAGDGLMVEAPRTGLNVRLVPVRWSRLFQATRVYGSVDGPAQTPDLGAPTDPNPGTKPATRPGTTPPGNPSTPPPSTPPPMTKPPSVPPSSAPPSKPPSVPPSSSTPPSAPPSSAPASPAPPTSAAPSASQPQTPPAPPGSSGSPAPASPAEPDGSGPPSSSPSANGPAATTRSATVTPSATVTVTPPATVAPSAVPSATATPPAATASADAD